MNGKLISELEAEPQSVLCKAKAQHRFAIWFLTKHQADILMKEKGTFSELEAGGKKGGENIVLHNSL